MMQYPVTLAADDNNTILVTFPDFPEAVTFGDDREQALAHAVDALETIIDAYIRDRQTIPTASTGGDAVVTVPALLAAKVQLYQEMRRQKVNKTTLAQRMNVHLPQIDRLLDVKHGSKIEQLEAAAEALGGHLDIVLVVPDDCPATMPVRSFKDIRHAAHKITGGKRINDPMPPRVHAGVLKQAKPSRRTVAAKKK